jgi:hypothetical protein
LATKPWDWLTRKKPKEFEGMELQTRLKSFSETSGVPVTLITAGTPDEFVTAGPQ